YRHVDWERSELTDRVRAAAGGNYVRLADGIVHYQLAGPASGRTVVLVHGFSTPYYIWDPLYDELAKSGFRVLRYDLYGRGYSDRPDANYDADLFDRQLSNLLAALAIPTPVSVGGLSMGGAVATVFAARHPEQTRSLVLVDPLFGRRGPPPWYLQLPVLRSFLMTVAVAPGMPAGQLDDFRHPERFPDWPDRYRVQMQYRGFRRAILSTLLAAPHHDVTEDYRAVGRSRLPVLLLWGRQDRTIPFAVSESVRAALPQAQFHA